MPVTTVDRTRTQRAREVENALASVRMEGLEISSEAEALFQQYVDGEMSSEELDDAFDRYFDRNMDPYVYPGTSVLRNLRGIRDAGVFSEFEAEATARRLRRLEHKPLPGRFDIRHLQAIHRHIFQDVYQWAGEFRTVNISKSGDPFAFHQHIVSCLNKLCGELERDGNLLGADLEQFAVRGAYFLGEINAIHPFRDGNGRSQREFIRSLGLHNGLGMDWRKVSRGEMIEASRRSLRIDNDGLEKALRKALDNEPNRQRRSEPGRGGIERGR